MQLCSGLYTWRTMWCQGANLHLVCTRQVPFLLKQYFKKCSTWGTCWERHRESLPPCLIRCIWFVTKMPVCKHKFQFYLNAQSTWSWQLFCLRLTAMFSVILYVSSCNIAGYVQAPTLKRLTSENIRTVLVTVKTTSIEEIKGDWCWRVVMEQEEKEENTWFNDRNCLLISPMFLSNDVLECQAILDIESFLFLVNISI